LGGGEVDLKLGIRTPEFISVIKPLCGELTTLNTKKEQYLHKKTANPHEMADDLNRLIAAGNSSTIII